jgi:shikimate dehydrogenase
MFDVGCFPSLLLKDRMGANYKSELVGVLGYPVAENPTCVMQEAAFAALNLPWRYLTLEVKPEALPDAIRGVRALGMQGINLTIPHKVAVLPLLDEISPDAALIGAVNTVRRVGNRLIGENTDGKGFLRGVREEGGLDPRGKNVVVLGAGGAARAITVELALAGAGRIIIWNRGVERGEALCKHLKERTKADAHFEPWNRTCAVTPDVDILVNATSIGLFPDTQAKPDVDLKKAKRELLVCDVVPNPPKTRFVYAAQALGLKTLTGLPMLVYQGAIGFEMWTGRKAPEAAMKAALEQAFR